MSITKTENGWLVDIQPGGRGHKRYRKTLPTKSEALRWKAFVENKTIKTPEWEPDKKDYRRLNELLAIWYEHHGKNLKTSEDMYSRLQWISKRLNNPYAYTLTPELFSEYRQKRLAEGLSTNSMNREHAYLKSAFNELIRIGQWKKTNPVEKIRLLKIDEKELTYLTQDQIKQLMQAIEEGESEDLYLVVSICLATGARWSEAINLKRESVRNGIINYAGTKSGKFRAVPIPESLEKAILTHKPGSEKLFCNCIKAFERAVKRAGLELPDGQSSHVLRHSFASHFMMNGGNILSLQKILGHQSLTMTMRYAHLSPDHLEEAKNLSPYSKIINK
ncbi:tyrosine-type recombinase/integrase [Methylomicrobium lacus]|uniref:phage integrase n=1 Tax=Methylomicrobium lacus TaxID=136992 RepID=UPI0035A8860F